MILIAVQVIVSNVNILVLKSNICIYMNILEPREGVIQLALVYEERILRKRMKSCDLQSTSHSLQCIQR